MLDGKGPFTATCDKCRIIVVTVEACDRDVAVRDLYKRGWLECARRGKGRERWEWWCPQCAPSREGALPLGRSTPPMPVGRK